ncbi:crotonase/enoyl-CoA hydratase family protein [Candidatus Sumerlaeota bacterium]|nr:crotonase/enoyl-CoA hydratase family protein [Candidatus Sumerlaeota bacterium]
MPVRIEKDRERKITTVIIDNPEVRNACDNPTSRALAEAFREFDRDEESHCAVLYGDHGHFCAGANLKTIAQGVENRWHFEGDGPMGPTRMLLSKPVIAAVAGYAVAGGLELSIWCDLRVVEEGAVFGVFCRRWGVPLVDGGTIRLPRLIGLSHALDMILTGRPVGAEEALRMGLANRVVPKGKAREEAENLAAQIASFPQVTMRNDRLSAHEQFSMSLDDAIKNEFKRGQASRDSGILKSGAETFLKGAGRHGSFEGFGK